MAPAALAQRETSTSSVPGGVEPWTQLIEAIAACGRHLRRRVSEATDRHGLAEAHFSLLWACRCSSDAGLPQRQLTTRLALSPAHVSSQLELLRQRGLIVAERDQRDRRIQVWRLTSEGERLLGVVLAELAECLPPPVTPAGDPDWSATIERLQELAGLAGEHRNDRLRLVCDHYDAGTQGEQR